MYFPGRLEFSSVSRMTAADEETVVAALGRFGSVVIDQTAVDSGVSCTEALSRVGRLFGAPILHRLSDRFGVHPIRNIPGYPEYANTTSAELNLHTDGAFEYRPPKVMLIYCERPADSGGNTRLCDGKGVHHHLVQMGAAVLEPMFRGDAYFIQRDDRQSKKAVFRFVDGRIQITYRYGADILVQVSPAAGPGFAAIEEYLARPENFLEFRLQPHQILVLDNTRVLHGRTAFPADAQRSLYGLWCDGDGPACSGMPFGFEP